MARILITGGAGFIGSALVRLAIDDGHTVLNVDALTYAGNPASLDAVSADPRYAFARADIADATAIDGIFAEFAPECVIHLAAESHVDRSIDAPADFIRTNVVGTSVLLEASRRHLRDRGPFVHVSTDEVFGSLGPDGVFTTQSPYRPNSPYAASKAAADHLARAWMTTYGIPVVVTNCSNNFGPRQFPEKFLPTVILRGLAGTRVPLYGRGENVRDWLYVEDHARGLLTAALRGEPGATYLFGARNEWRNVDLARRVLDSLDRMVGERSEPRSQLIEFVVDRPGHDGRYAIDPSSAESALGWTPQASFDISLEATIRWYVENESWWRPILAGSYRGERLGLGALA